MAYRPIADDFAEDVIEELIAGLEQGRPMNEVCADKRMPSVSTFWRWAQGDDDLAKRITHAREAGYLVRAEKAVADAKIAKDGATGRLAFDAERWMLGKLSNAFSDDKKRELKLTHSFSPEAAKWLGLS